jgi:hypothetical protein
MRIEQSIQHFVDTGEVELQTQKNLLSYDVAVLRDICEASLKGNYQDLNRVGYVANRIVEKWSKIQEVQLKIVELKLLLQEFE